jgi:histidinol dehydrogenase
MQSERIALTGEPRELARRLRALVPSGASVSGAVAEIVARVRQGGDQAVLDYTQRFDGADPRSLRVQHADMQAALDALEWPVREGLELAIENVARVAAAGLGTDRPVAFEDHVVTLREAPVERAGVYVPGGRAPYPSTVVMGVVTACTAGVPHVAVCAPPGVDGEIDRVVLAACRLAGAETVYRMGGAQAIAALAYGTETVDAVDVIVGPGNLYVQEAKRQVSGDVGIDGFAGPSDLLAIAGDGADPEQLALDLLAQAEHGPGTIVVAVCLSNALTDQLAGAIAAAPDTGAVVRLIDASSPDEALGLAQAFAPEHLQLAGADAERLAPLATHAGCVFVGAASGTAFGDYIAGSNHILPTAGAARFASALSTAHFRRRFTEVRLGERAAAELARAASPVARAEGFELHARSMESRIRDNARR